MWDKLCVNLNECIGVLRRAVLRVLKELFVLCGNVYSPSSELLQARSRNIYLMSLPGSLSIQQTKCKC
jgi:hypothetical protein